MTRRRTPLFEVVSAVVLIVAGILTYVFYSKHDERIDGASAITTAREHMERGETIDRLIAHDNPGAEVTWSVVATTENSLVRVGAKAVRTNGLSEYRFDVDIESGRVHAANPLARELIEPPPDVQPDVK